MKSTFIGLALLATLNLALTAPLPQYILSQEEANMVEDCYFLKEPDYVTHDFCRVLAEPNPKGESPKSQKLREYFGNYSTLVDEEAQIFANCYFKGLGSFYPCLDKHRKSLPILSINEARLRTLWTEYYQEDIALVFHCFWFHQAQATLCHECRGISYKRNLTLQTDRNRHILATWNRYQKDLADLVGSIRQYTPSQWRWSLVLECLYGQTEGSKPELVCDIMDYLERRQFYRISPNSTDPDELETKADINAMIALYEETRDLDQMTDCLTYHSTDRHAHCFDWSWDQQSLRSKSEFVPKLPHMKKLWKLAKSGANTPKMLNIPVPEIPERAKTEV